MFIAIVGCSGSSSRSLGSQTVAFSGITANGTSGTVTTSSLTLAFDVDPTTLTLDDITVSGATKDTLTGTGLTRTLAISNITVANGENVTVTLANPTGYIISPLSKTVAINKAAASTSVTFSGITANGTSNSVTTTALTLTFDVDPSTLSVNDITVTGATKGALSGSGTTRTLAISNITVANGEKVTVSLANPAGFTITPGSKTVAVNVISIPVTFAGVTANGASGATTTTALTLTFSADPTSLAVSNITLTGATKGILSGTGTTRTLTITDITVADGATMSVTVNSPAGFTITGSPKTVAVYKATTGITFSGVTQSGGSLNTADSTALTLTFSADPTSLAASDISLTGATKGALSGSGTTRTLAISAITVANGATVSITVSSPAGYSISGSTQTAVVYKALISISAAGVTGFVAPVTGVAAQTYGDLTRAHTTYTVTSLTWNPAYTPYAAATVYTATVVLTSTSGYKFPAAGIAVPTATSGAGTVSAGTTAGGDISGNTLSFTVAFPATTAAAADVSAVSSDKTSLVDASIQGSNADLSDVKVNLYLPSTGSNGTTITWSSNSTGVVSNDGSVTRPSVGSSNATVIMTATISKGGAVDTKTFTLTVLALTASTFTITFNGNGGSGTMATQSIDQGSSAMLLANAFTRTSYQFTGWAMSSTGGVAYNDGQSYTMGGSNVTLYAVWVASGTLLVHYNFDGQNCNDSSGNGTNGTAHNITYVSDGNGGYAASFNGSSSYVEMPQQTISSRTTFTVMMRFKTSATNSPLLGYQNYAAGLSSPSQFVSILNINASGYLVGDLWNGSAHFTVTSPATVNDNAWHTVYFSNKTGSISLYLDGAQIGSNSSTVNNLQMYYNQIGASNLTSPVGWYYFNGLIDDFYLYSSALN